MLRAKTLLQNHLHYLRVYFKHKYGVFLAGRVLGLPLWRLLVHDLSKLHPAEYLPAVAYRALDPTKTVHADSEQARIIERGRAGILRHILRNKHHAEAWPDGRMEDTYVIERVANWWGAGYAYNDAVNVEKWYAENKARIKLHPDNVSLLENCVAVLTAVQKNQPWRFGL